MRIRPRHHRAFIALLLLVAGVTTRSSAQPRDAAVEGVWRMVEEVDHRADGSIIKTGPVAGYNGLLIFTSNGYISSTIMPRGRTWRRETATPAALRETFESASAHAGRYECNVASHTIRMENVIALDPADEGNWDVVRYRVRRDSLELSGPWTYNGEKLTFTMRLVRLSGRR